MGFLDVGKASQLYNDCIELNKSISALIKTIKAAPISGIKFKS